MLSRRVVSRRRRPSSLLPCYTPNIIDHMPSTLPNQPSTRPTHVPMLRLQRSHSAPHTKSQFMKRTLAAICIQRFVKRKDRRSRAEMMWPSMDTIRRRMLFLDSEALEAGAMASSLYTDDQLRRRDENRKDVLVVAALAHAWTVCCQRDPVMSKATYLSMYRRIYLVVAIMKRSLVSPSECRALAEKDWVRDTAGHNLGVLTRDNFETSWFLLSDLYTEGVSAHEYTSFILRMVDKIARPRLIGGRRSGEYEWRDDRAIWAEAAVFDSVRKTGLAALVGRSPQLSIQTQHAVRHGNEENASSNHNGPSTSMPVTPKAAAKAHPLIKRMPVKLPAGYGVFGRMAWLAAFADSRRVELAHDAECVRLALERMEQGGISLSPPEAKVSWAQLTRGRSRQLLSERLEHASRARVINPVTIARSRAMSVELGADDLSSLHRQSIKEESCELPRPSSSLFAAIRGARAHLDETCEGPPQHFPRRPRAASLDTLADIGQMREQASLTTSTSTSNQPSSEEKWQPDPPTSAHHLAKNAMSPSPPTSAALRRPGPSPRRSPRPMCIQ